MFLQFIDYAMAAVKVIRQVCYHRSHGVIGSDVIVESPLQGLVLSILDFHLSDHA
jgi:hypothetical protein